MTIYIVLTQLPDRLSAEKLARGVIQERLAACVTQMPAVSSIYTWQGVVEQTEEFPLLFKTTQHKYAELEAYIISHHPYEVPEILAWPIQAGATAYMQWVRDSLEALSK